MGQQIFSTLPWLLPVIIIAAIWEAIWKLIALWKAARNNHLEWFIFIAVLNTLGILSIVYILLYRQKK